MLRFFFIVLFFGATSFSQKVSQDFSLNLKNYQTWVRVDSGKDLFIEWVPPQPNRPIVILLNGITYQTSNWNALTAALSKKGLGILRFDFQGHGKTLAKYGPMLQPIPYTAQVEDLRSLLQKLKIPSPYNLVGLSYGGGIAQAFALKYPQYVKNMILMAPYTRPIDSQDMYINSQILATKMMLPFSSWTQDELYDYYLKVLVYSTFPYAEPVLLEKFKLEATFRLIQGIRKYQPQQLAFKLKPGVTHLMMGAADTTVLPYVLNTFWNNVNPRSRMSRIFLTGTQHKIPELIPNFAASWVNQIVSGNPEMFKGQDFVGYPRLGYAQSVGGLKLSLDQD